MMEAHRNDAVSAVFRDMVRYSEMHRDEIKARVGSIELPKLKSWQYRWSSPPEVGGEEGFDYMIEPYHALKYARANEVRAMEYYRTVSNEATDAEVRRLAADFANEGKRACRGLDNWLARTPRPSATWDADPIRCKRRAENIRLMAIAHAARAGRGDHCTRPGRKNGGAKTPHR